MRLNDQAELDRLFANNPDLAEAFRKSHPDVGYMVKVPPAPVNKYHIAPKEDRTYNGVLYASAKEAKKAAELDMRVKAGDLTYYLRQVPFWLPGGIVYRSDFMTFAKDALGMWWIEVIECKGYPTPEWKLKLKLFRATYPFLELEIC